MLAAGARCEVMAVVKGYRWGAPESTCFRTQLNFLLEGREKEQVLRDVSAQRASIGVAVLLTSEISSPYRMRLAQKQYERRESWSSACLTGTMRLPVSNTVYFRWIEANLLRETVMVVRAS